MTRQSEAARATWIAQWIDDAGQDLKHAFRGMQRDAGFTTFVILIVDLSIGASATIFSVVNALLLRPLPFHDASSLSGLRTRSGAPKWAFIYICETAINRFPIWGLRRLWRILHDSGAF